MVWKEHSSPLAWSNVGVLSSMEPLSNLAKWLLLFFFSPNVPLKANIHIQSFQGIAKKEQCIQFREEKKEFSRSVAAVSAPLRQCDSAAQRCLLPAFPSVRSLTFYMCHPSPQANVSLHILPNFSMTSWVVAFLHVISN